MNNPCGPLPIPAGVDNPCALLPTLRSALYDLMSGKTRSVIRFGDQQLSYHNGNVKELRAEVRRFETICGTHDPANAGRAVRVGPLHNPLLHGFGRY